MAKWTEDTTYKFVQEYLKHECLYNCKDPKYKSKGARDAAHQNLSEVMDIPGFGSKEVYTKIRNLKSTYSQEVKKIKQSVKSGAGTDDIYSPHVKWFKLLDEALKSINVQYRDSQSNMESESQLEVLDGDEASTSQHNRYAETQNPDVTPEPRRNLDEEKQRISPIPRKRTVRDLTSLVNKVKNVADAINTPTQTETEFDIFGRSVAAHLKSMPLQLALQGQMFIQNYLCKLRLQQMGHGTSSYVHRPPPHSTYQSSSSPSYTLSSPNSPYTQIPQHSPYPARPLSTHIPFTQDPTDNIPPADQSPNHLTETLLLQENNDNAVTLYSGNKESHTKTVRAAENDIFTLAVADLTD